MAQQKIEDLSTENLIKKRKLATWLMGINALAGLSLLSATVYDYLKLKEVEFSQLVIGIACTAIVISMYPGLKKVREELNQRT